MSSGHSFEVPLFNLQRREGTDSEIPDQEKPDEVKFHCYQQRRWKRVLYILVSVLSFGIVPLLCQWYPKLWIFLNTSRCHDIAATHVYAQEDSVEYGEQSGTICAVEVAIIDPYVASTYMAKPGHTSESGQTFSGDAQFSSDEQVNLMVEKQPTLKYFVYKRVRHIFNVGELRFQPMRTFDSHIPTTWFVSSLYPLASSEVEAKLELYGENDTTIPVTPLWKLALSEVINPFYAFQIASVALWVAEAYFYYAFCILFVSVVSIAVSTFETHKQQKTLHRMSKTSTKVLVCRAENGVKLGSSSEGEVNGETAVPREWKEIDSKLLVPGDLVTLPQGQSSLSFDAVLVSGSCVVNESSLTGESVPVTKCAISNEHSADQMFSMEEHKKHILFSGTEIVQSRSFGNDRIKAVVIRTGFQTNKGELIRSILYPRPMSFQFYKDALKFVFVLSGLAAVGTVYSLAIFYYYKESYLEMILKALDVITICVPPALPAALTVAVVYSQSRLKHLRIFCMRPSIINVAGRVNLVCYDKTGTITEDGMDVYGVIPSVNGQFVTSSSSSEQIPASHELHPVTSVLDVISLDGSGNLLIGLGVCHALSEDKASEKKRKPDSETNLVDTLRGDPLDVKMFEFTGWGIEDKEMGLFLYPPKDQQSVTKADSIAQVKLYPFSSEMQRMSIIAQLSKFNSESQLRLFSKGSPEVIASLCLHQTIPSDLEMVVQKLGSQGYRVIALACKNLSSECDYHLLSRTSVESDLEFLGLIVMENRVKPDSSRVVKNLHGVNIRQVMITGDNLNTAVSVARQCKLIPASDKVVKVYLDKSQTQRSKVSAIGFKTLQFEDQEEQNSSGSSSLLSKEKTKQKSSGYHFVLDGKTYYALDFHYPDLLSQILLKATVFARMKPKQKSSLVQLFSRLGYTTCMCGDGSNDCGALRNADVGISLSEAEASIAAPFTSNWPSLTCVPAVIKEGRCALATSFSLVKFMVLYSMIQFISVIILYSINSNLSDLQFLYIDLVVITSLALVMSRTGPSDLLAVKRPRQSLINIPNITSVLMHIILAVSSQLFAFVFVRNFNWYQRMSGKDEFSAETFENSAVFAVSIFQYVFVAVTLSKGAPHRARVISNALFVFTVMTLSVINILILFQWPDFWTRVFELQVLNTEFKLSMTAMLCLLLILTLLTEFVCERESWLCSSREEEEQCVQLRDLYSTLTAYQYWPPEGESISRDLRGNLTRHALDD